MIALFCRQYDIIKDNEPNNSKEKAKSASENSTPEHQGGGLLRSKVSARNPFVLNHPPKKASVKKSSPLHSRDEGREHPPHPRLC